jgi:hypothetical protein
VADGVDADVDGDERARGDAAVDDPPGDAGGQELPARDDPPLPVREPASQPIERFCCTSAPHAVANVQQKGETGLGGVREGSAPSPLQEANRG